MVDMADAGAERDRDPAQQESREPDDRDAARDDGALQSHDAEPVDREPPGFKRHENKTVALGSLNPETGYFLYAECTSRGAAIASVSLSDPRYRELTDLDAPLKLLGNDDGEFRTLASSSGIIDNQLGTTLADVNWEVVHVTPDGALPEVNSAVEFKFVAPDGSVEVRKRYSVVRTQAHGSELENARDTDGTAYQILMELSHENLSTDEQKLSYELQGPVGVVLENEEHTRVFRNIRFGKWEDDGSVSPEELTAAKIHEKHADETLHKEKWQTALKYIGVDVQFFAALLVPRDPRSGEEIRKKPWIKVAQPVLIKGHQETAWSDISVVLRSREFRVPPGESIEHAWSLYAGPKRRELLEPGLGAAESLDYGWFGGIAGYMLSVLGFIHNLGVPYGLAIICLTVMVRACMFPITRKQAVGAKKMKELQPQIAELKSKYGDDRERMAREQMDLFRRNNYNPLSGCLPVFLQLPIFIGLYTALNNAVDLRLARFLWIDNLAAPDALFRMPFALPLLGQDFNILPVVTIVLFIVQQKMFMPPPTDDQQAMQQKMMNYMMIVFGVMFWHVPSGLCVYFIASSLWGLAERKILDLKRDDKSKQPAATEDKPVDKAAAKNDRKLRNGEKPGRKVPGFMKRLLEAAQAANQSGTQSGKRGRQPARKDQSGRKGKKRSKR